VVRDRPRVLYRRDRDHRLITWGTFAGSFALTWLVVTHILPITNAIGFLVLWFLVRLGLLAAVTSVNNPGVVVRDRLVAAMVRYGAGVVVSAFVSAVLFSFFKGWRALVHLNFYTTDMAGVRPTDPLTRGGIWHAIAGTLVEIGIAIAISVPLGVGTAVFMTEVRGRFSLVVRTIVEAMTALPSVVAGLFAYTVFIISLGFSRSGFVAAMALTVMMLPIIARASDVVLRVVPGGLREAGLALGSSQWRTIWHVVLPTARSGLATAIILGIARGVGETSPVLLTSGASTFFNVDPLHYAMNSLPLFVLSAVRSPEDLYITRGYAAASVLLVVVLLMFVIARRLARGSRRNLGDRR
jgi:phosphate transport system permease protein